MQVLRVGERIGEQRVAVRRRPRRIGGADHAGPAGAVFDHDALADLVLQHGRGETRRHVRQPAGRKRHDHGDRPGRIALRLRLCADRRGQIRTCNSQAFDGRLVTPIMCRSRPCNEHARCDGVLNLAARRPDAGEPSPRCNAMLPRWSRKMADKNAEPLLPVELGPGKVKFAQGMKAGRWVFATGVMAQDFKSGIAPDVLAEHAPHAGLPKREKEALRIFENLDAVLRAAGTDRQPRPHRPVLHDGEGRAALSAGPARVPARAHSALDLDRAAGTAAARRRHEHPGARRHPARLRGHASQARGARRAPDLGLFARGHRRRLHLHSRHHLARGRQRAAAERRRRGRADDRGRAMGRPADQARDRVHHQGAHGAVAGAGGRHARGRRPRPGLSHRPRRTIPPSTKPGRGTLRNRRRRSTSFPASSTASRPTTARSRSTCWR